MYQIKSISNINYVKFKNKLILVNINLPKIKFIYIAFIQQI